MLICVAMRILQRCLLAQKGQCHLFFAALARAHGSLWYAGNVAWCFWAWAWAVRGPFPCPNRWNMKSVSPKPTGRGALSSAVEGVRGAEERRVSHLFLGKRVLDKGRRQEEKFAPAKHDGWEVRGNVGEDGWYWVVGRT